MEGLERLVEVSPSEKHSVEYLGDLYAVVIAIERLEKAHYRDLITGSQYKAALRKLLEKYANIVMHLKASSKTNGTVTFDFHADASGALDQFIAAYCPSCAAAKIRIQQGHPDDIEKAKETKEKERELEAKGVNQKTVWEAAMTFVTLVDCLKLNNTAVDDLFPYVNELVDVVEKLQVQVRSSPSAQNMAPEDIEFQFLPKLKKWKNLLESMSATDELDEKQAREMAFDVDNAGQALNRQLASLSEGKPTSPQADK